MIMGVYVKTVKIDGGGGGVSTAHPLLPAPPLPAPSQFMGEFLGHINSGIRN